MATQYDIARTEGQCGHCGRQLAEGQEFFAVLVEDGESFIRHDWCLGCWESPDRQEVPNLFSVWRSRIPVRQARKKLFVDDEMLVNFFQRLAGDAEPARLNFRFVLALVLMRKKLLTYDGSARDGDGVETWHMRLRGSDERHDVVNPRLDEQHIGELSEQLSQILHGEL
jgi:hypothetical protein